MSERSRSRPLAEASTDPGRLSERSMSEPLTPRLLRDWPLPVPDGGKHARGTVLVVGGAPATTGAVLLAGVAALRAGAGVLRLAVAESRAAALGVAVPEAAVYGLPERDGTIDGGLAADRVAAMAGSARVVLLGPGLDEVDQADALLRALPPDPALVLDAYALAALARRPLPGRRPVVLTPNVREGGVLLDREVDDLAADAMEITRRY